MIDILVITSGIPTPADAISVARSQTAAEMIPRDQAAVRTAAAGNPETAEKFPQVMSENVAIELFGSEEEMLLMKMWEKRRAEEFRDLPVRKASLWNDEYDRLLEPVKDIAESHGRIMTPAVYINGELISSGRAVKPCELEKCLKKLIQN